ncbi:MAG: T9SS type A sorting domain-containing protein [Cryomorphaceae bacterium]|nr:T9SS type A sorting domain-containing protein [Cryomorphaceae bacterium]
MKKLLLLLTVFAYSVQGQNLALSATATASASSSGNYGPANWNDGVINGTYFGWVGTDPGSFSSPAWMEYEWTSMQTLDCLVVYNAGTNFAPPTGNAVIFNGSAILQEWNGASWDNITTFSGQGSFGDSYAITFSPVITTKIRILFTTTSGNHNPGFDEIEVFLSNSTQNTYVDLAVTDIFFTIDTMAMEMYVDVEVTNVGTQKAVNFTIAEVFGASSFPALTVFMDSLLPNETRIFNMNQQNGPWDISSTPPNIANMTYCATVNHPLDTNAANDEMCKSLAFLNAESFNLAKYKVDIYPNPTRGDLFIQTEERLTSISLRDMSGRLVFTEMLNQFEGIHSVSTGQLSPGQYILTLEGRAGQVHKKIIVQ